MNIPLPFIGPLPFGKVCNRCAALKPMEEFHAAPRGKYRRTSVCKTCRNAASKARHAEDPSKKRAYYEANRERLKAYGKARRQDPAVREAARRRYEARRADPEQRALDVEKARKWRDAHPWKRREHTLKERYGISPIRLSEMVESQGGGCAICQSRFTSDKTTHIDHDHSCCPGKKSCGACVRGILCHRCNLALGMMRDDPARLEAAAAYLRSRSRRVYTDFGSVDGAVVSASD
jgi:hypothetical protein